MKNIKDMFYEELREQFSEYYLPEDVDSYLPSSVSYDGESLVYDIGFLNFPENLTNINEKEFIFKIEDYCNSVRLVWNNEHSDGQMGDFMKRHDEPVYLDSYHFCNQMFRYFSVQDYCEYLFCMEFKIKQCKLPSGLPLFIIFTMFLENVSDFLFTQYYNNVISHKLNPSGSDFEYIVSPDVDDFVSLCKKTIKTITSEEFWSEYDD